MTPDSLPTLAAGAHVPHDGEACVMEYVALLAGEPWTDSPKCTHPVLAEMARLANDFGPDDRRYELVPLIGRLFGTGGTLRGRERRVLAVRLAAWCARQTLVFGRIGDDLRSACQDAVATAEAWCDGTADEAACDAASEAVKKRMRRPRDEAVSPAMWVPMLPFYVDVRSVERQATTVAYMSARTVWLAGGSLTTLLSDLLDEYDRLTGRADHRSVTGAELRDLSAMVTAGSA